MRIKLIVNPSSGQKINQKNVSEIIKRLSAESFVAVIDTDYTTGKNDALIYTKEMDPQTDIVIACGGDGTVNEVVNGLAQKSHDTALAIYPTGSANDFASYLGMPREPAKFIKVIKEKAIIKSDIGKINSSYFINVASAGLLANIAHQVTPSAKSIWGHLAYLAEGAKELTFSQDLKTIRATITSKEKTLEDDILMFIVSNSPVVGGFRDVSPRASVSDGKLDVLLIHRQSLKDLLNLFLLLKSGKKHTESHNVTYFQTEKLRIDSIQGPSAELDIDGEKFGCLPANIQVVKNKISLVVPEEFINN